MAGLFARWTADDDTQIPQHEFGSMCSEEVYEEITQQEIVDRWSLDAHQAQQLSEMLDNARGAPRKEDVLERLSRFEACINLANDEYYGAETVYRILNITTVEEGELDEGGDLDIRKTGGTGGGPGGGQRTL